MTGITNSDLTLCKSRAKYIRIRLLLLNEHLVPVDELQGVCTSGSISVDAGSEIRRTCSLVLFSKDRSYDIGEYQRIWLNRRVRLQIGMTDPSGQPPVWYSMGIFAFNSCSYTYSADARSISIQCGDLTTFLDGSHGGTLNGTSFTIPAGRDMKQILEDLIKQHTDFTNPLIESIGEYGCQRTKSSNWKENRLDSGSSPEAVALAERDGTDYLSDSPYLDDYQVLSFSGESLLYSAGAEEEIVAGAEISHFIDMGNWHLLPKDLEFSSGTTLLDLIREIRELYPGYESYFDPEGTFHVGMIPTCEQDPLLLDFYDLSPMVIQESVSSDFTNIKNATQIYGQSIEADRYCEVSSVSFETPQLQKVSGKSPEEEPETACLLHLELENFQLTSNQKLAVVIPENLTEQIPASSSPEAAKEGALSFELPVYLRIPVTTSGTSPSGALLETRTIHTIPCVTRESLVTSGTGKITTRRNYPPAPLSLFTPGESCCFQYNKSRNCFIYLGKYQIEAYTEDRNTDSPFSVDKIGLRLQVLHGGTYDKIADSTLCRQRAEYENWLAGRLNDTITLQTVLIPFLDVNRKVRYQTRSGSRLEEYIVKQISFSFPDGTCQITLAKFYPQYPLIIQS